MDRLGRYELVREIAVGGMAEVHLARVAGVDGFEKYVAIKMIHPNLAEDREFVEMLVDEAKLAVRLAHPNIAQTFDLGKFGGTYYMTMEYVDGVDISRLIRAAAVNHQPLPFDACAFIAHDIASALEHAHSRCDVAGRPLGVVHRDVSPQNVMVSYDGVVKLVDFGIAKASFIARKTQVGVIKGKYSYMSPEQVSGLRIDGRSDIYSAGIVLYEMITGRPLYLEDDTRRLLELCRDGVFDPPSSLRTDIPLRLEKIALRALAAHPDARYQHAGDLAADLQEFLRTHAPRYSSAQLAALVENLVELPDADVDPSAHEATTRRVDASLVAQTGDSFDDENSVILPIEHESTDAAITTPRSGRTIPKSFGKYEVHEQIGGNVLAKVHRATMSTSSGGRDVVLKLLAPQLGADVPFATRFAEELARASSVRHENLVELFEYGRNGRAHFVSMELVHGIAIRKLVGSRPAPIGVALAIVGQLLDALVAAHAHSATHGGVTPANVMIVRDGQLKLADLGIARALHDKAPIATAKLGYLAPETATSAPEHARSDVFSVGVIAWELIAGRRLFDARNYLDVLDQLRTRVIDPPSQHGERQDAQLDELVLAALSRDPGARPSAAAMRDALRPVVVRFGAARAAAGDWAHGKRPGQSSKPAVPGTTDPEIRVSIEDPSKTIEIGAFLVERPPRIDDTFEDLSKDMVIERPTDDD